MAMSDYQNKLIKGGKGLMGGAALFIGATTILDTALTLKERKETRDQVEEQEEELRRRKKEEAKRRQRAHRRRSSFNDSPQQLVFDMFDNRSGHHKMGNSRFTR